MKKLLTILLFFSLTAKAADKFYVSITGTGGGSGTIGSPWDLQTALNHPGTVGPADTIYIQAGTYTGTFISLLTGTLANPIIVKAIGRAIIDGTRAGQAEKYISGLEIKGAYTWYMGLELTNSDADRVDPFEPPGARGAGIEVDGTSTGIKVINCIVHDAGNGFEVWNPGLNAEIYGNIVFNNGWEAPSNLTGHGVYTQNTTATKSYIDNIFLHNFGYGFHAYGSGANIKNFYLEGNLVYNDTWLMGGGTQLKNVELNTNFSYKSTLQLGYSAAVLNDSVTLTDNFLTSGVSLDYFDNITATGNTIFIGTVLNYSLTTIFQGAPDFSGFDFDNNTYYWVNPAQHPLPHKIAHWVNNENSDNGDYFFSDWQALGQDLNSTVTLWPVKPFDSTRFVLTGKNVFVRPNAYDANRTHIVIYNWDLSSTVNVSVAGILSSGDAYELRNVQDYFDDVVTGTFAGGDSLAVPMTGHTVELPIGYGTAMGLNTFPDFGTFVLIKTGSATVPATNYFQYRGRIKWINK